ncbi:MAG TPA: xanthine dehydrogenase family protein subunit M [Streptosporangiaceae bacterium]
MRDFAYARAGTAESAVGTLADPGTSVIAGGTELLNWFRLGIAAADNVVDIGGLDELRGIASDGDNLRIGALATLNEIGEHPLVTQAAGALSSACLQAASAQIRNRATIGGNVLQRTRCPYFRAEEPLPWPCNKRDPGSGCTSLAGRHERQAIFGWTEDCVAVQPSDPAVALAMLDAQAEVLGPAGPRTIPMREFHLTQREAADAGQPMRETRLEPGELITGYRLPASAGGQAYVKVRERASYEYAIVSAAAAVRLGPPLPGACGAGRIAAARVALGSVAQRPWCLTLAEAELPGTPLTREALTPVIERAMADAVPLPQNGFKVLMARNAAVRALLAAGGAR